MEAFGEVFALGGIAAGVVGGLADGFGQDVEAAGSGQAVGIGTG